MKVLISGYYGFGNAGDEAVLAGVVHALRLAERRERGGEGESALDIAVVSSDPAATERAHGVTAVGRREVGAIWRRMRSADLFVSGGGGLLQDATSQRSALYYLGMIAMAHRAKTPVYLYAQGVGPLRRWGSLQAARAVLPKVAGAGARDWHSVETLRQLGTEEERVRLTADAAFALDPPSTAERTAMMQEMALPFGDGPLIGVAWRNPVGEGANPFVEEVSRALAGLARAMGAGLLFMSFHPAADDGSCRGLARAIAGIDPEIPVYHYSGGEHGRLMALVAAVDFVVTVRFHGLVFSAIAGVPALALAYDPKVSLLADALGVPWLPFERGMAALRDGLERAWERADAIGQSMRQHAAALRGAALEEGIHCLRLLRSTGWRRERAPG